MARVDPLDELFKGLSFDTAVPSPAARQQPVRVAPPEDLSVARLPRPRPQVVATPNNNLDAIFAPAAGVSEGGSALDSVFGAGNLPASRGPNESSGASAPPAEVAPAASGELPPVSAPTRSPQEEAGYWEGVEENWRIVTHGMARGWNRLQQAGPAFRGSMPDWMFDPEKAAKDFTEQGRQAAAYGYEPSEIRSAAKFNAAEGFWGKMKALVDDPAIVGTVMSESFGQAPLSVGLGAIGSRGGLAGAAIGTGYGSAITEYGSSVGTFLQEKGFDVSDEDQMVAAFSNERLMLEARQWATKRGVSVGVFDGLTALIGGPIVSSVARKLGAGVPGVVGKTPTISSKGAGVVAGMTSEVTGGVGGEAAAQIATTGTVKMDDLILEGVGELGGGIGELAVSTVAAGGMGGRERQKAPTKKDVDDAFGVPGGPRIAEVEEAEAEGRTLFGFDTGEGPVEVGTYDEAEQRAGETGVRKGRLIAVDPKNLEEAIDFDKLTNTTAEVIDTIPITGTKAARARGLMNTIADPNTDDDVKSQSWEELAKLTKSGEAVVQRDKSISKPARFVGDSSQLGVNFRQVDYLGLDVGPDSSGKDLGKGRLINDATHSNYGNDLDGRKISPGTLLPEIMSVVKFVQGWGEQEFERVATEAGNSRTVIENTLNAVREGSGAALIEVDNDLISGALKLPADPRLTLSGVRIANTDAAVQEVKNAIVSRRTKTDKMVSTKLNHYLKQSAPLVRKPDGKVGEATLVDPHDNFKTSSSDQRRGLTAAVSVIESLIKKWDLPFDIKVVPFKGKQSFLPDLGMMEERWMTNGFISTPFFSPKMGSHITIGINLDALQTGEEVYRVMAHEFGHVIAATGFMLMKPEVRTGIFAAYRRFLLTTTKAVPDPMIRAGMPGRQDSWNPNYLWSFEEWFADQIARWALTNRRPLGFVAKHVRPLAKRLLEAMKKFAEKDPFNLMRPEPEIENWLRSTLDGTMKHEWGTEIVRAHEEQTRIMNERAGAGSNVGPMSPMTPQSVQMREMVAKLGVEKIEAMAASMGVTMPPLPRIMAQVDRFNWFYQWALSLPQVAERNLHIDGLQKYRELVQLGQLEQGNIMTKAHNRLGEWRKLGKAQAEALGQLLFALTQMSYLTAGERAAGVVRQPSNGEFAALVRQFGLSQKAVQVYGGIKQDFEAGLLRYVTLLVEAANGITDPAARQTRISDIAKMHANLLKRPYFPMTRYGKWTITVRENNRLEHFETFESKRQQQVAYKRARRRYPHGSGYDVQMGILAEEAHGFLGVPPQMLDMIASTLQLSPTQQAALEQLKFELAPAQSFKKRFMTRSEISGWSDNAQRNYAHYFFHHAKHYMRTKYAGLLNEQVKAVRSDRGLRGDDARKLLQIANFMNHHMQEVVLNPKADWAALRSAAAVWYLGAVPQSALLNLTQLGFATAPFLASKFGDFKTLNAMRKATGKLTNFYKKGSLQNSTDPEIRALAEAMDEGIIDESQAAELAALSEGNTILSSIPGGDVHKRWLQLSSMAMMMFQATEQWNRRVTFRATWQLAMDNPSAPWLSTLAAKHQLQLQRLLSRGWSQREAMAFLAGKDATLSTQFEYARYARPRFMQGRKGAIFMFYMFTQNMTFMLWNNKGVLPRFLLTMAFLGGAMALPGLEDAADILKAMAYLFGKDFDVEREARKMIVEVTGDPYVADIALRGISRDALNLGVLSDIAGITAMPQIDMSKQISMGKVLPMNPAFLVGSPGLSQERAFSEGVVNNAGAMFGIGFNLWKSLTDFTTPMGDMRRWERALPRSIKNVVRAQRLAEQGGEMTRGLPPETIADFDWQDPAQMAEILAVGAGLQSTRISRGWDRKIAEIEISNFWKARRKIVLDQFIRAVINPKSGGADEAVRSMQRYNMEVVDRTMLIKPDSVRRSIQTRLRAGARVDAGLSRTKSGTGISLEMRRLYPDAVDVRRVKTLEKTSPQ